MREIKFRAWDFDTQKMIYTISEIDCNNGELVSFNFKDKDCILACTNRKIFLQYTGLKDENEKKIYEGDIVKYSIDGCIQSTPYKIEDMMEWFKEMYDVDEYYRWDVDNIEVIGNIYENPELVNGK